MKRPSLTACVTGPFVEPTSVTVVPSPLASRTAATCAGRAATGAATSASSTPATASSSESARSTASRSTATASASASTSQPRTSATPAARAASPTEAPISPVPTMASERTAIGSGGAHELGDPEGEIERLTGVEARVAEAHVPRVELPLLDVLGPSEALGHILPRELEVDAAGPGPLSPVGREETLDLPEHRVEVARLPASRAREDV